MLASKEVRVLLIMDFNYDANTLVSNKNGLVKKLIK